MSTVGAAIILKTMDNFVVSRGALAFRSMAHALKIHALVSSKTLPLHGLSAFEGKRVEVIVVEDEGQVF